MGSRTDGTLCKHFKSPCHNVNVRFICDNGFSVQAWCPECGGYIYSGRIEGLLALKVGDIKAYTLNYNENEPDWVGSLKDEILKYANLASQYNIQLITIKQKLNKMDFVSSNTSPYDFREENDELADYRKIKMFHIIRDNFFRDMKNLMKKEIDSIRIEWKDE